MKIVVLGGSGFLGSNICDKLSSVGHEVTILDIKPSPWLHADQKMLIGSILDEQFVNQAVCDADVVFNYAGIADIGEANLRPVDTARINVMGNIIVMEACRHACVQRYIFASSLYVYGKSGGFYRCSKQACELYIENYALTYGMSCTILRYGSLYGPRAPSTNAIARFAKEAISTGVIRYYGSPDSIREYIHIDDASVATLQILAPQFANENIIISGNQPLRIADLFRMLGEMLGKDLHIEYEHDDKSGHYRVTPYSFIPQKWRKLTVPCTTDLRQGILHALQEERKVQSVEMLQ